MEQVRAFIHSEMVVKSSVAVEERFSVYFKLCGYDAVLAIYNKAGDVRDFQYLGKFLSESSAWYRKLPDPEFQCNICSDSGIVTHQIRQWDIKLKVFNIISNRVIIVTNLEPSFVKYRVYFRI